VDRQVNKRDWKQARSLVGLESQARVVTQVYDESEHLRAAQSGQPVRKERGLRELAAGLSWRLQSEVRQMATNTRTTCTNFPSEFTSKDSCEVAEGHSFLDAFIKQLGWLRTSTTVKLMHTLEKHICMDGRTPLCSRCKCRFAAKGTQELTMILPLSGNTKEIQSFRVLARSHRKPQRTGLLRQDSAHDSRR
jgi:hypothetical protein